MSATGADYRRNAEEFGSYWAPRFRWRRSHSYSARTKIKRFRHMISEAGRRDLIRRVFDQGFGLGEMLFSFPRSTMLAGLEISQEVVEAAKQEAAKRGYADFDLRVFQPGQPYPNEWRERFDLVISSHVLEHISDPKPVLEELIRLLRPGGAACIVVPINERPGEDLNHFHQFDRHSLSGLLEGVGLQVREVREVDRLWHLLGPAFYRSQRNPSGIWRLVSIAQNAAFGLVPHAFMAAADMLLKAFGVPPRQCFAWCVKPMTEGRKEAHRC